MKKTLLSILLSLVALSAAGCSTQCLNQNNDQSFGASSYISGNSTSGSVTTTSTLPTLVIPRNTGRQHAVIVNDGNDKIYLYTANFDSADSASTTVLTGKGIMLSPQGGSYEIDANNLKLTDVWVSTTSAEQNVTYAEN